MKRKKVFKIISIMLILIIFFPYTITLAATVGEVGNAIATFAVNYYNGIQSGANPYICHSKNAGYRDYQKNRAIPESGTPIRNPYDDIVSFEHYGLDCVGWVNFCVYNATGIKFSAVETGSSGYVTPQSKIRDTAHFAEASQPAQPGDILYNGSHVLICVGEGKGIESNSGGDFKGPYYTSKIGSYNVARITETGAAGINADDLNMDPSIAMGGGSLSIYGAGKNQSEFYYNGVPDGEYSVAGNFWDWIVDTLAAVFEFLINLCGYVFRMVFVGWTFIVEELMTYAVNSMANEDTVLDVDSTTMEGSGFNFNTEDNITIEKIIFDKVKVFDVNFFKAAE